MFNRPDSPICTLHDLPALRETLECWKCLEAKGYSNAEAVFILFKKKEQWRKEQAALPFSEKMKIVQKLNQAAKQIKNARLRPKT